MILVSASSYDPDAPEDARPLRSEYISARDLKGLIIVCALLGGLLAPIYYYLKGDSEQHQCAGNFKAMFNAMGTYAELYDDRYPPLYAAEIDEVPFLDEKGRAYTWVSLLHEHMPARRKFTCPSARPEENVPTQHPTDPTKTLSTSYGVYSPMALRQRSFIANPSQNVLIAETSNRGTNETYDPMPLPGRDSDPAPVSGFVIGYDDSNGRHTDQTRYVTRLAFPGSAGGKFEATGRSRHRNGIHALFADGRLGILTPPEAQVEHLSPELTGIWQTR